MARRSTPLYLQEEILLLLLHDEKGTVLGNAMYPFALAGAMMAELVLAERIAVEDDKRKRVRVARTKPIGDPVLDECLERIASAKRQSKYRTWLQRFAHLQRLRHRIAEGLCRRGILRMDESSVLLIFKRKLYPEVDPRPEKALIKRLRDAIFTQKRNVDARTAILIALADSVNLLQIPFAKSELRPRKQRIKQLAEGALSGDATRAAVQAAQTAAVMAAIIPAISASAISTS